ncbi:MAG: hypothetical protein BLM47_00240 [Candidatus Reconcilbacillus cellulovorans]|uniref:Uncharacterized protein n=1 Tax=Candidatus Reconcilbacillus cellulovorans TaxID=1906605 RepID=A0A2A6E389_9BACL|nr:MAG: hypothetical protein BLM47_00240 [Candidatus Reconcilbacillus cellulovorans]
MNFNQRNALIACSTIRVILRGMQVDGALDAALAKAGVQVSEIERAGLRRDAEAAAAGRWPGKPGQLEAAI